MPNLLEVRGLEAGYGQARVLHGVNIDVARNSVTAIIGSNGAGKTTMMRTIAGLVRNTVGVITFEGKNLAEEPTHRRVDMGIALVPEGRLVFPDMTVEETLRIGAFAPRARRSWSERRDQMYEIFPRLKTRRLSAAGSLSGGEQQMLALARGLMSSPTLLLLDEPSLGLSPAMAEEVLGRLEAIRALGVTVCLVEQNVFSALTIADHGYVLEHGSVVMQGKGSDLIGRSEIRASFLGL